MKNIGAPNSVLNLEPEQRSIETWPSVDTSKMSSSDRDLYERRYQAICGYMRAERIKVLTQLWGLSQWEIRRLRNRCLKVHPDGRLWGFRALIPRIRTVEYLRIAAPSSNMGSHLAGNGGLLTQLFHQKPKIMEAVYSFYLKKTQGPHEPRMPIKSIHKRFLIACREAGVKGDEFPFNMKYLAIRSLATHLRGLQTTELKASVLSRFGAEAARTLKTGTGQKSPLNVTLPLQRVQFDGHKIDAIFIVKIPLPGGGFENVVLHRPWLLIIQDVASRAILGWHLSLNREYTKDDVLRCVRNSIEPRPAVQYTVPGLVPHKDSGMPSTAIPEMAWAVWAELMYDNGKANLAEWVRNQLSNVLNCTVNAGPVRSPERRGIIEALFRVLEENSFHRMPNTTGGSPSDKRRSEPVNSALQYNITLDHLYEILSVVIENYNGRPHTHLSYRTPLEMLRLYINYDHGPIRHLYPDERSRITLLDMNAERVVRGDITKGRRPYIEFEGERYTNQVLARMPELIGTTLTLIVNTEDLRTLKAFLSNGSELGLLEAIGKWAHTAHSLATRRAGNRRRRIAVQHYAAPENTDAVHVLLDHLGEAARRDKRAIGKHEEVRREAGLPSAYYSQVVPTLTEIKSLPKAPMPLANRQAIVF